MTPMTSSSCLVLLRLLLASKVSTSSSAFQFHHAHLFTSPAPQTTLPTSSRLSLYSSTPATAGFDITENAPRDLISLRTWAANYGVQTSDCFELTTSNDALDVFVTTNRDLPADTPLVCVPAEVILTGNKARQELGTAAARAERTLLLADGGPFYLFLKVLQEFERGEQSPWYCYLNSLPRYYSNGASMTDFCFGCLPPYAATQARAEKQRLKRFELALDEVSFLSDASKGNAALTQWAFNAVHTRYQELPGGDVALVPMADMFNHGGAETEVCVTYDDEGNCYVCSTRDVPAGAPLNLRYGDPTNPSKLMARYGFLDESSSATFCKWIAEEPSAELYQLGYPDRMLFYSDGGISNEAWDCFLYEELGKVVSPAEQREFYLAHTMGDDAKKQSYHEHYLPQSLAALRAHVTYILTELEELGEWQSTVQDKERHANLDAAKHPRLPLIKSHNEFVKCSFELVQQNLDNMSS